MCEHTGKAQQINSNFFQPKLEQQSIQIVSNGKPSPIPDRFPDLETLYTP